MLSLVVPAYNESVRLPPTLERIREHLDARGEAYEVIVVDDGSSDGTDAQVAALRSTWPQLRGLRLERNSGKGAAIRAGMLVARGEHRAFSDADLSAPIEELDRLRAALGGRIGVAIASRAVPGASIEVRQPGRRHTYGRLYNRALRLVALPGIHDSQCGLKVFTADAAVACFTPLRTLRFGFDAEVLLRARRLGFGIAEVPVRWRHIEDSRVRPVRDGARVLIDLVRLRLRRR